MAKFKPIPGDEAATTAAFEAYMGGAARAGRLFQLYKNSNPSGTALDRLYGRAKTKADIFRERAAAGGFTADEIDALLAIQ